jgi:hypothetical protein
VAEVIGASGVLSGRVPWHPDRGTETQPRRATS